MSTLTCENAETELFVTTETFNIASKLNIHSCAVSDYLQDLPYDDIPAEIIALITKFYLSKSHTSVGINKGTKNAIPRSCDFQNAIPTTKSRAGCCSTNSLLSICQFLIDLGLWAAVCGVVYASYWVIKIDFYWHPGIIILFCACVGGIIYAYYMYLRHYFTDVDRVITAPISNIDDRILSLNNIFNTDPLIEFHINGSHTVRRSRARGGSTTETVITFEKKENLRLNYCETVIEPNIYQEAELYDSCCYHFEFEILLHFDDEMDRTKYQNLCTQFINNNIHDVRQHFESSINYNMFGLNRWSSSGDNHGYLIVVNQKCRCLSLILKSIVSICTVLCVSWVYKIPFYVLMKRKRLKITKYLSIRRLEAKSEPYYLYPADRNAETAARGEYHNL